MASTNIYLNFKNQTEEAFNFYKSVFGGEFEGDGLSRFGDMPVSADTPEMPEADKQLVLHVSLPILGGTKLMGSDAPESLGLAINMGNNVSVSLHPDDRTETDRLFAVLSAEGKVVIPLQEMFWGDYFGSCTDRFGVCWMFNCESKV